MSKVLAVVDQQWWAEIHGQTVIVHAKASQLLTTTGGGNSTIKINGNIYANFLNIGGAVSFGNVSIGHITPSSQFTVNMGIRVFVDNYLNDGKGMGYRHFVFTDLTGETKNLFALSATAFSWVPESMIPYINHQVGMISHYVDGGECFMSSPSSLGRAFSFGIENNQHHWYGVKYLTNEREKYMLDFAF